jgi:hypothetical protein
MIQNQPEAVRGNLFGLQGSGSQKSFPVCAAVPFSCQITTARKKTRRNQAC